MFDKIKDKMRIVTKKKPAKPLAWIEDLLTQARLARKEGLSEPLTITLDEIEELGKYRNIVLAAEEFWEYHRNDIDWMHDNHVTRFLKVMRDLYDRQENI